MTIHVGKIRTSKSLVIGFGKLIACVGLVAFNFSNRAAADGPWTASTGFSSIEGANQWYYQERPIGGGAVANMLWNTVGGAVWYGAVSNDGWIGNYQGVADSHPGESHDTMRVWSAPSSGTISITGQVYKMDTGGGAGVIASVEQNGTVKWSRTLAYNDATGYTTDADLGAVTVNSGDTIAFILDDNGTFSHDQTGWDPTITKTSSYTASAGYSSIEGANQWYYQERPIGGGAVANMLWNTFGGAAWYGASSDGWIANNDSHPGESNDTMRVWVAPSSGNVSITGHVYKMDTGGGGGVIASVEQNGTLKWSRTLAYNDATGYTTDADLGAVTVNSGDTIAFILATNGTFGYDQTGWDPTISLIGSSAPCWCLDTSDTLLKLTVINNQPAISRLEDATTNYNWTPDPVTVPLLNTVYESSTGYNPNWSYTSATVDTSSGTKVTLTFASTNPSLGGSGLTLTQCWWAHPGVGPVEETASVTNNTGVNVTYNNTDVVPADLTVTSDAAVTLWRFYRIHVGQSTGLTTTAMSAGRSVISTASNDYSSDSDVNGTYILPFIMLDVPGAAQPHGLYMGYWSDFANINITASSSNANQIESIFSLYTSGSVTDGSSTPIGNVYPIPGMFFGTYAGDTDDGSNKMKQWFWTYKITPTIKSTTNEPLYEVVLDDGTYNGNSEAGANYMFSNYPFSSWGAELVKEDAGWGDDQGGYPFGDDWNFTNTSWPNGMNLGSIAHNNGVKLSLYMANRYNGADLSTTAGVTSEETALQTRFSGTATNWVTPGFDYWRSDMDYEGVDNYLEHVGFMQVLDYMISNNSGFRWENCSAGGSKKSFDLLQRQSNQTTVDDQGDRGEEHYREAYYGNSYMINPIQLQFTFSNASGIGAHDYIDRAGFLGGWMNGLGTGPDVALYQQQQRPILRGADVYHVLPVCDETHWDGIEFLNTTLTANPKGSVVLFKPNTSTISSGTFYLKGLIPTMTYSLSYQDRTGSNASMTGSALMAGGTGLSISGSANAYDSEIIWLSW